MLRLSIFLFAGSLAAQITGVTPSSYAFRVVSDSASGPKGPALDRVLVSVSGTGTVTWTDSCFGNLITDNPSQSATLPIVNMPVRFLNARAAPCQLNFSGASGSTGTFTGTAQLIPNVRAPIITDAQGRLLTALGYCTYPVDFTGQTAWRTPSSCTMQEGTNIRPGGTRTATAAGASYGDATFGGRVVNQGSYTRSYVAGSQISYNRDYVVLWAGTRAVLHKINAPSSAEDLIISGPGGICDVGSTANIGLGTTAASATLGFCLNHAVNGVQKEIKKFSFAGGVRADLGVIHTHPAEMPGFWGTGQAASDGWVSHYDLPILTTGGSGPGTAGATSFVSTRWPASTLVLHAGDTIQVNATGQVHAVAADVTSDSGGSATINVTAAISVSSGYGDNLLINGTNGGNLCALNWMDATPTDTCTTVPYIIRNAMLSPWPSRSTGLHYAWVGSDNPNKTVAFSFDSKAKVWTLTAKDLRMADAPTSSTAGATWTNGANCTVGLDCIVGGHHNTAYWGGEAWECGTGRGRLISPIYTNAVNCVRGYGWDALTGIDHVAIGGPVANSISAAEAYFAPAAKAPILLTTDDYGNQGIVPAWRIATCSASSGTATCTAASGSFSAGGFTAGVTAIYVDGFTATADLAFNGRFTLSAITSTTFSYACATCSGTSAVNVASMAKDIDIGVQKPTQLGRGRLDVCRPSIGHCRAIAQPMNVSYGGGTSENGTGNWLGLALSAPGYQGLSFPTIGMWGERVCWVTDWGYLEKLYVACAETGRPDLGLAPFDLDENTQDWMFDRHGRGVQMLDITSTGGTIQVQPTNPAFGCKVQIQTRRDFGGTDTAAVTLAVPVGTTGSVSTTALASGTQYYMSAKCSHNPATEIWDYGVFSFRTK